MSLIFLRLWVGTSCSNLFYEDAQPIQLHQILPFGVRMVFCMEKFLAVFIDMP